MSKDEEKTYNGSYLYRLNEELSGQAEIAPYFVESTAAVEEPDELPEGTENKGESPR